uniref:la-related protein 1C-like n=1 Tax=Fragaria vesca subsp. vesca TaxID=101020 RepID=UPI0005CB6883|nr:PREDICTED: la-related protein 1C-like [Fragaria vesca subsp. vesca]
MAAINAGNKNSPETTAPVAAVQSPRGESVSNPQSRKAAAPWMQIVRGESEPIVAAAAPSSPSSTAVMTEQAAAAAASFSASSSSSQSNSPSPTPVEESAGEGSENGSGLNGNAGKKPAWNKPSNGAEIGPVMGAVSWPALSDARASSTKSSTESVRGVADAPLSVSVTQGAGTATISSPKQVNSSSTPTHSGPARQRLMKQRNNAGASSNGGVPHHQTPAGQGVEVTPNNPSPKEHSHRSPFGSQTQSSNEHPQPRSSLRNRNGGPHPRGDGSHHHNYGGRHQDRGSQDWNNHRNFNSRDNHMHPQRVSPRGMRPTHQAPAPPTAPPFFPQPMRPFAGPIGFGDFQGSLVYFHPGHDPLVPFMALPQPPLNLVRPDLQLHTKIINQIDYYFSNENLIKDTFLRRNMDDQGWVRIKLIAGFNKVMNLTDNIQIILDALRMSTVVEVDVQGDKIRRRNDWMKWVMPAAQPPTVSSSQTLGKSGNEMLSAHIQSISLDEKTTNNNNIQNNSQPQLSSGDGAGQFSVQGGADRSISARN